MPNLRKFLAKTVLSVGLALGAVIGALWFYLMWQSAETATLHRNAMAAFSLGLYGGFGLSALIAWPFTAVADYIDPPPQGPLPDATKDSAKSAHHSRPSRSTVSRQSTQR
jgi:hypothetical protein